MINLIDGYVVDADKYCYIMGLLKTRISKDKQGEETYIHEPRFYPSLCGAVQGCVDTLKRRAVQSYTGDLIGAVHALNTVQRGFEELLRRAIQEDGQKEAD